MLGTFLELSVGDFVEPMFCYLYPFKAQNQLLNPSITSRVA
jgi:hypothetical protein